MVKFSFAVPPNPARVITPEAALILPPVVPKSTCGVMMEVVKVGDVSNTTLPLPVSSVIIEAKFALEGVVKKVCTPEAVELSIVPATRVAVPAVGD
jgi:hypothetical protein